MNRLRQIREVSGESQAELSRLLNVAPAAVSNWEQGIRQMDYDTLITISRHYSVTVDYLIGADSDLSGRPPDEAKIISKYRGLPIFGRKLLNSILDALVEHLF